MDESFQFNVCKNLENFIKILEHLIENVKDLLQNLTENMKILVKILNM